MDIESCYLQDYVGRGKSLVVFTYDVITCVPLNLRLKILKINLTLCEYSSGLLSVEG